jgi:hypothetical protein
MEIHDIIVAGALVFTSLVFVAVIAMQQVQIHRLQKQLSSELLHLCALLSGRAAQTLEPMPAKAGDKPREPEQKKGYAWAEGQHK